MFVPEGENVPPIESGVPDPERVIVPEVGESVPVTVRMCETVKSVLAVVVPVPIVKS